MHSDLGVRYTDCIVQPTPIRPHLREAASRNEADSLPCRSLRRRRSGIEILRLSRVEIRGHMLGIARFRLVPLVIPLLLGQADSGLCQNRSFAFFAPHGDRQTPNS